MNLTDRALEVGRIAWDSLRLFSRAQGLSWAGAVGLYLFLSVPPLMVASALVADQFVLEQDAEAFVLQQAAKFVPAREELLSGVFSLDPGGSTIAGLVSLGFLLVSGSRAFAALTSGINVMWRQSDKVSFWQRQGLRIAMLGFSLVLLAVSGLGELAIGALFGGDSGQSWLLEWQLLPTLLLGALLFGAYRFLPQDEVSSTHAAIGAVLATIGVRVAQAVMGFMAKAGTFDNPYGDLAGVALMATWALVVGVAVLFGATVVAVLSGRLDEIEEEGSDPLGG
ncbi:MAG: YihY/virulence factor BrkB family protein [Chloroflexi bacterium]|nr:YihY/virulence factor BrkB family protein [Chloroflexota bacterium]